MSLPTPEEIQAKFAGKALVVVVCRRPGNGPAAPPGARRGIHCTGCGAELEATLSGLHQIASGGIPMCGPCGVWFAEEAARRGSIGGVATTREADASIDRGKDGGNVPLGSRIDRLRKKYPWEKS